MKKTEKALSFTIPGLLLVGFGIFALTNSRADTNSIIFAAISVLIFGLGILLTLSGFLGFFSAQEQPSPASLVGERSARRLHPWFKLVAYAVIAQLIFIVAAVIINNSVNGFSGTFFEQYPKLFIGADKGMTLIQTMSGDILNAIPLTKTLASLIGGFVGNVTLVAFVVNMIFLAVFAVLLYETVLLSFEKRTAVFTLVMFYLSPIFALAMLPYSDTAVLLTFAMEALYASRKGKLILSGAFGMLATAVNPYLVLLFVPILMEGIRRCVAAKRTGNAKLGREVCGCVFGTILPLVAFGAIFAAGLLTDKLQFINYQFSEGFRFFFEPLGTAVDSMLTQTPTSYLMIGSIAAMIGFGILICACAKKLRPSYATFMLLWYALVPAAIGSKNLLYGILACPILPLALGLTASKKAARCIFALGMLSVTVLFMIYIFVR